VPSRGVLGNSERGLALTGSLSLFTDLCGSI
jgi:hypothetical protein